MSKVASVIGMQYNQLKPLIMNADTKQRKIILTAKPISIALYTALLFLAETQHRKKRLETIIIRVIKWIFNANMYVVKYTGIYKQVIRF